MPASGHVPSTGRTPKTTPYSLLWRAHHRGCTVDGKRFALFKVGWRLWVRLDEATDEHR